MSSIDEENAADKARYEALCDQAKLLDEELKQLQTWRTRAFDVQGRELSTLLASALVSFGEVLSQVNEFDDKLLLWYRETKCRKTFRIMLSPSKNKQRKLDNASLWENAIATMTDAIRTALFNLESRFKGLEEMLKTSYQKCEAFQDKLETFSTTCVGAAIREAQALLKHYQAKSDAHQLVLDDCTAEMDEADMSLRVAKNCHKKVEESRQAAEKKAKILGGTSIATVVGGSFATGFLLACATVTLPVVLGGAAIYGGSIGLAALQGRKAIKSSDKAEVLKVEEGLRAKKVCDAKGAVAELTPKLTAIQLKCTTISATKLSVENMAVQTCQIRVDAQSMSQEMRAASMTLSSCEGTVRITAIALQDAGFADSRLEMTTRLSLMLKQMKELGEVQQIILDKDEAQKVTIQLQALEAPTRIAALKEIICSPA